MKFNTNFHLLMANSFLIGIFQNKKTQQKHHSFNSSLIASDSELIFREMERDGTRERERESKGQRGVSRQSLFLETNKKNGKTN